MAVIKETWRDRGQSNIDFFNDDPFFDQDGEIIALASYPKVCFGVWEWRDGGGRAGIVIPHSWNPHPHAFYNYTYQILQECNLGSNQARWMYRCPKKIIDQLDRPEDLYGEPGDVQRSLYWREECLRLAAETQSKPRPKPGQTLLFKKPIHFSDGETIGELVYVGRNTFQHPYKPGWQCRLPHWREREYQVLEEQSDQPSALERILGSGS